MDGVFIWERCIKNTSIRWIHFTINPGDFWTFSRLASRNQRMSMAKEKPMGSKPSSSPGKRWFWVGEWLWYPKNVGNIDEILGKSWAFAKNLAVHHHVTCGKISILGILPTFRQTQMSPNVIRKKKNKAMFFMIWRPEFHGVLNFMSSMTTLW